jgi:hypothetical protein
MVVTSRRRLVLRGRAGVLAIVTVNLSLMLLELRVIGHAN